MIVRRWDIGTRGDLPNRDDINGAWVLWADHRLEVDGLRDQIAALTAELAEQIRRKGGEEMPCHCPDDACGWRGDSSLCGATLDGMLMCPKCENAAVVPDGVVDIEDPSTGVE